MEYRFSFNVRMLVLLAVALLLALGLSFGLGWVLGAEQVPSMAVLKAEPVKGKI